MNVGGVTTNYPMEYKTKRAVSNISGKGFDNTAIKGADDLIAKKRAGITQRTSVMDIYNSMSRFAGSITKEEGAKSIESVSEEEEKLKENDDKKVLSDEELEQANNQDSETKTDIIVKPDGSRVLVVTMSIGGMETTMSLEISKPTDTLNENADQEVADDKQSTINDSNLIENQVTDASM